MDPPFRKCFAVFWHASSPGQTVSFDSNESMDDELVTIREMWILSVDVSKVSVRFLANEAKKKKKRNVKYVVVLLSCRLLIKIQ